MKRFAHLWLPLFATDRVSRPGKPLAEWRARPLACVTRAAGGVRIAAANAAAREAGIGPGLSAADAQAICPGLKTIPAAPAEDAGALAQLAEWCQRWSPSTAPEDDQGVWIDITGCAHLFGGESTMLETMADRIEALGFSIRAGLADTPGAAWAMSHFGESRTALCPEGAARQWLSGFPIAALRLPPDSAEGLRRLGIRRIGDMLGLPRAPLVARFGELAALRLDQLFGRVGESIAPRPPSDPIATRLPFAEPIGRTEDVAAAIRILLNSVCVMLEAKGLGARRLELKVFRVDGSVLCHAVGNNEPVRDPVHLMRLFAEALDGLDAGFGIEVMSLTILVADPLSARQQDLEARPCGAALPLLIDRLSRRLGPGAVHRLVPRPTHLPERLQAKAPPLAPPAAPFPSRPRPLRLLAHPKPAKVTEADGVPVQLNQTRLTTATGPERIAAEWWGGAQPPPYEAHRDYWRVESEAGQRLWLFRLGDGRWFLHGSFG